MSLNVTMASNKTLEHTQQTNVTGNHT